VFSSGSPDEDVRPLWVICGHVQCIRRCPLCAISGHGRKHRRCSMTLCLIPDITIVVFHDIYYRQLFTVRVVVCRNLTILTRQTRRLVKGDVRSADCQCFSRRSSRPKKSITTSGFLNARRALMRKPSPLNSAERSCDRRSFWERKSAPARNGKSPDIGQKQAPRSSVLMNSSLARRAVLRRSERLIPRPEK
jgi:hypothetical protein